MKQNDMLLLGGAAILLYLIFTSKASANSVGTVANPNPGPGTVANPNPGPGNVNMGGQDFGAGLQQTW